MTFPRSVCLLALGTCLGLTVAPAPAGAQHFGRNKVQYRAFDFQVIQTPHFDIYFYEQERTAALDAARMAERAYARLSRVLQHEFRERKPIILYASHSDFQQTNATGELLDESTGGFAEPIKSRLVLPFTGSYADFDHVLTHELVHAFQQDIIYRRGVINDSNPFSMRPPLWFMEGMAEYLSLGRIDAHTESWLRDAALAGYLRSIAEMSRRDDYLSYRFGQSLWSYVGSKWGDEVIGVLLQKTPRVGLERAFESTLGIPLEALSREWMSAVRHQYLPQVAETQRPSQLARRLTAHEKLEDEWYLAPALSPDGRWLTFLSQRDGFFFDLYLADAATGKVRRKLVNGAQESFESLRYMNSASAFSPDGRYLAFSAQTGGRDALYVYDLERGRIHTRLRFELNGVSNPSWSPDGTRIVFTGLDGGISDLFVTDLSGRVRRLTRDRHADLLPSWSPDGRSIAFSTDRGEDTDLERLRYGNLRVALYDLESGTVDVLPGQREGKNLNPVWSPDGRALVWISDRTGVNDLYVYRFETRSLERITNFLSGAIAITPTSPALTWSRSGALAFVYFENAGYNVYSIADPLALPPVTGRQASAAGRQSSVASGDAVDAGVVRDDDVPVTAPADSAPADLVGSGDGRLTTSSYYRDRSGFRPSADLAPNESAARPISIAALMDSVESALPDAAEFSIREYDVKFTPDYVGRPTIGAQVGGYHGSGIYGGSFVALSDMLGNHNIVLAGQVNGSFSDAYVLAGYTFLKRRANFGAAVEQVPFYRYLGGYNFTTDREENVAADVYLRDVIRTAQGVVSYPFSTYRRMELGASATYFQRDALYRGVSLDSGEPFRRDDRLDALWFVEPTAALVFDNTLFGWTGPVFGRRYRLQASQTFGSFRYAEVLADVRGYRNFRRTVVLAARLLGQTRFGRDADRFAYFWGYPYYIRGYDNGSFDLTGEECRESRYYSGRQSISHCPVRDQLIGSSAAFANFELRVPVITELHLGPIGSFPPVDAVAFFDGGIAWDHAVCRRFDHTSLSGCAPGESIDVRLAWDRKPGQDPYLVREPLFSYGLGLRFNVFYAVLRLDYAFPVNRPDRGGRLSLSFGPSF